MKITVKQRSEDELEKHDWRDAYIIDLSTGFNNNLVTNLSFYDGEPEDANLGRDFNDVYGIKDALVQAYEAGKRGEELVIEELDLVEEY